MQLNSIRVPNPHLSRPGRNSGLVNFSIRRLSGVHVLPRSNLRKHYRPCIRRQSPDLRYGMLGWPSHLGSATPNVTFRSSIGCVFPTSPAELSWINVETALEMASNSTSGRAASGDHPWSLTLSAIACSTCTFEFLVMSPLGESLELVPIIFFRTASEPWFLIPLVVIKQTNRN